MSSFRNAVKRRAHKERSQPSERNKYGLLEKHKDYVLRAKDFHKKERTLQILQEKAAFRNPDEFYHKMINSKTVKGVHRPKSEAKQYTHEEILLMKTQDIKYVSTKAQSELKKVERLQSVLHFVEKQPINQHVFFAEDSEEVGELKSVISARADETPSGSILPKRIKKARAAAYRELEERKERAEKLRSMAMAMSMQKEVMGKGRKRKLRGEELGEPTVAPVFKWRKERKK